MRKLTGLAVREPTSLQHRCACGCGGYASFGFPGGLWFAWKHIPAELLAPPAPIGPAEAASIHVLPVPSAPDLFDSAPMDWGFRPT